MPNKGNYLDNVKFGAGQPTGRAKLLLSPHNTGFGRSLTLPDRAHGAVEREFNIVKLLRLPSPPTPLPRCGRGGAEKSLRVQAPPSPAAWERGRG